MGNTLKKSAKIAAAPFFCFAFYEFSGGLASPHYSGGMDGFAALGALIMMSAAFIYGGAIFWLYLKLFDCEDSGKINWIFTGFFLAALSPLVALYLVRPNADIMWRDGREMYFYSSEGVFLSVCLITFLLFLTRLNRKKSVMAQIHVAILATIPTIYTLMHMYDTYIEDKWWNFKSGSSTTSKLSKAVLEYMQGIYDLLPPYFKEIIEEYRDRGTLHHYADDEVIILLASLVFVPIIVLVLHKLLCDRIRWCKKAKATGLTRNLKKLCDAIAWYTIIMPPIIYVCRCINGYLTVVVLWMSPVVFVVMHKKLLAAIVFRKGKKQSSVSPA